MNAEQWRVVKEIFHEALDCPPAERPGLVSARAGADEEVAREVQRLLAAESQSGNFIEQRPAAATLTGRRIGRYEIGRMLGAGGMGEVYAARDLELGREVAIKFAVAENAEAQNRLRREAQHASQLNHPNICTIYEVGTADGRPFIAMEYVRGQRLADAIPEGGLPVDRVVEHGSEIADALAYAHQHGVLHRDLKPGNIGLTPEGRAKVLDFGLARRLHASELKEITESSSSILGRTPLAGTLSSMAPETLRGEADDERSDIWALGVLLYEMATGSRPFGGATPFQLSGAILHESPPPLPARVPARLKNVITRCLEKEPGKRYQSATEVRAALAPKPITKSFRLEFGRPIAVGMAVIVISIITTLLLKSRDASPAGNDPASQGAPSVIAVMPFDASAVGNSQLKWLSSGLPSMLTTGLLQTPGLDVVGGRRLHDAATQLGMPDLSGLDKIQAADVARRAGASAVVLGSIFQSGQDIRIDAQLEDLATGRVLVARSVRGTDVFSLADRLTEQIRAAAGVADPAGVRGVADVSSRSLEAYRFYTEGITALQNVRMNDARLLLETATQVDPDFAEAYLALAGVNHLDGRPKERAEYLAIAARHASRLGERQRMLLRVETAREAGQAEEAARALDELLAKFPTFDAAYSAALWLYSPIVGILQDPKKAVAIQAAGAGAIPSLSMVHNLYAYALMDDGRFAEAIEEHREAAKLAPREPNPYDSLGESHLAIGETATAIDFYTRALEIDPTFTNSHLGLAFGYAVLGRYDEALSEPLRDFSVEAFFLSRVGRYREAERILEIAARGSVRGGNVYSLATGRFMSALLLIERRQFAGAVDQVKSGIGALAPLPAAQQRGYLQLAHTLGGLAEAMAGRAQAAREHLVRLRDLGDGDLVIARQWINAVEAEIAIAERRWDAAAAILIERKVNAWLALGSDNPWIFATNMPSRDGLARVAVARGDLSGAIAVYRRLTRDGGEEHSSSVLEPRHVLQLARLLERSGDKGAARREYQRFITFWKNADTDLPELAEARRALSH